MEPERPIVRRNISLVPITNLGPEAQMEIRDIRNEDGVRRWMHTDHEIGANEHLGWLNRLKNDANEVVFAVTEQGLPPIGVASVNRIDWTQKSADWGYYLTHAARGAGLATAVLHELAAFAFDSLQMEKINSEVIEGNDASIKLHRKLSFREEGFRRSNILKSGIRTGVHLFGLTREDWEAARAGLLNGYVDVLQRFVIDVRWRKGDLRETPDPIDQIQSARAKSDRNRMAIIRLALEKSPRVAEPLVSELRQLEQEISTLTDKLLN